MNKKQKAKRIAKILDELFGEPEITLKHKDPYTLLVSTLLSAQCTDKRVNKVTGVLFKKASNPYKMRLLGREKIYKIIKSCGLGESKSRAIFKLSKILNDEYEMKVPDNFKDLEKLPGVGHKTASVVMSQAFNKPAFPVDTHIHRLAKRWGLSSGKSVTQTENDLKALFPQKDWKKIHLQIIYFGRKYCPARGHDTNSCPVCSWTSSK